MITSSEIVSEFVQSDGSRHVREKHISGSIEFVPHYTAAIADDINAVMAARVPRLNKELAHLEIDQTVELIQSGEHLSNIVFTEQTAQEGRARTVKTMLRSTVEDVIIISQILDDYTDTQIRTLLGVGQAKYDRIKTMMLKARAIENDYNDVTTDPDRGNID